MNNKEYWLGRINKNFSDNYKQKRIKQIYTEAYTQIESDVLRLYDELSSKGKLTTTKLYSFDRFQALLRGIKKECNGIRETLIPDVTKSLSNAYKGAFKNVGEILGSDSPWGIQNEKMLKSVLETKWAGSNYSNRIWKNTKLIAKRVESDVVTALTQGESGRILAKQIEKDFNVSFHAADRIVRTEIAHAINQGQLDAYKSDGVRYVEWSAAIESGRTCELCKKYDGKVFETDKCPVILHPNCRCTMLPVLDMDFEKSDKEWEKWLKERNLKEDENGELIDITTGKPAEMHRRKNIPTKTVDNSAKSDIIELPNIDKVFIRPEKFTQYALNPKRDVNKAKAFKEALGYDLNNVDELIENIVANLPKFNAVEKPDNGYGKRYEVLMTLIGANNKKANVKTSWIVDTKTGQTRLTSAYVTRKKLKGDIT